MRSSNISTAVSVKGNLTSVKQLEDYSTIPTSSEINELKMMKISVKEIILGASSCKYFKCFSKAMAAMSCCGALSVSSTSELVCSPC